MTTYAFRAGWPRRLLLTAGICLLTLAGVPAASATPATPDAVTGAAIPRTPGLPLLPPIPGIPDCKDAPVAQLPDEGIAGALDPAPSPPPPAGDPFGAGRSTSVYDQYGYAGLRWSTYDLGCGGGIRDPEAAADTMTGNLALSAAVFLTVLSNGLHNQVAHPASYLTPLDSVVTRVTNRIRDVIWSPWGAVSLLAVAGLLLLYSLRGQLSTVMSAALWALLVLAILSGVAAYPQRAASFFDTTITETIGNLQAGSAGLSTGNGDAPGRAQGALTVDVLLYQGWVRGALGSSDNHAARTWGPRLFAAQALTRTEAREAADPARGTALLEQKAQDWKDTAAEIAEQEPATYAILQGKAAGRTGAGILTLTGTLFTLGFRTVADGFLVAALVMLRLLVMFFPAAAVIGILAPLSAIVRRLGAIAAACLINVVAFAAASVLHTTAISAVLSAAQGPGMTVMALLVSLVLTVTAFVLMLPFLSLTRMVGARPRTSMLTNLKRNVVRYAINRKATSDGTTDATENRPGHTREVPEARARVNDPPRSETYRRATPIWDVTSHTPAQDENPVPPRAFISAGAPGTAHQDPGSTRWPPPPPPPPPGSGGPGTPGPGAPHGGPGPHHDRPGPGRTTAMPVIVGEVLPDTDPPRHTPTLRSHDGNVELRDDGSIGYRIFDPATDGPDPHTPRGDGWGRAS